MMSAGVSPHRPGWSGRWFRTFVGTVLLIVLFPNASFSAQPPDLMEYRITERAPIIKERHDKSLKRALDAAFRQAVLSALREIDGEGGGPRDFSSWQKNIFSRSAEFIFSYRILSREMKEGYLTISTDVSVYRDKLEKAVRDTAAITPALPVKLLVMVDTFPLSGAAGEEDIDGGHLAASALESEFLRRGAVIIPSPDRILWRHLEGRASAENRSSLARVEGERLGADYVLLGRLQYRVEGLLVLFTELISVASQKTVGSSRSPVEFQANAPPHESFVKPVEEAAGSLTRHLFPAARRP